MVRSYSNSDGGERVGSSLNGWWHQPDRFDWTTNFLRERHWLRSAQVIMAVVAGSSALGPVSNLVSRDPRPGRATVVFVAAAFTIGMTAVWLMRWPTRRQSEVTVLVGVACIAGWSATEPNSAIAALTCTAAAVTGGYVAFFHGPKLHVLNLCVAVAIASVAAVRLDRDAGLATAVTAFWVIWFLNVSVPIAIWGISEAMCRYAIRSDEDPLTGLLNRRGFIEAMTRQLATRETGATHLTVHMVDLDDFKRVNDTHGHAAGDRVLTEVADLLRNQTPPTATICRAGGEEFLVAMMSHSCTEGASIAPRLCAAISAIPDAVTASIGSTCAALEGIGEHAVRHVVEGLIAGVDTAMYAAKRDGGNQVHTCERVGPTASVERPGNPTEGGDVREDRRVADHFLRVTTTDRSRSPTPNLPSS
jgi:diguanylate cyclase (GGDEF)-like protein